MPPLVGALVANGLNLLAKATMEKGKEWVEAKTGVDLSEPELSEEKLIQLRQYEMEHESELMETMLSVINIDAELDKSYLNDRANARSLAAKAFKSSDPFVARFTYSFAIGWSLFGGVYMTAITFLEIPKENIRFADSFSGFLTGTIIATIIYFIFGTSRSSGAKDLEKASIIDRLLEKVK
jgi:hypothetical protein